jgi:hypothetical protein
MLTQEVIDRHQGKRKMFPVRPARLIKVHNIQRKTRALADRTGYLHIMLTY